MSNRVKVTVHDGVDPNIKNRLFLALETNGYEPFSIHDGSDPGDFCAAVSVFAPMPYVLIRDKSGNRAAAIAHETLRSAVPNPCIFKVKGEVA